MTAQPTDRPAVPPAWEPSDPYVWIRLPHGGPITHADLDDIPEGTGLRFELVDGTLLVSPAMASTAHQRMARDLFKQLDAACPPGLEAFPVALNFRPTEQRGWEPDVLVVRSDDLQTWGLSAPPLLVVEIRSPSTRLIDLTLKRAAYEEAGVPSYWLVDPLEPSLTALELSPDGYREVARVVGGDGFEATTPFPVSIRLR